MDAAGLPARVAGRIARGRVAAEAFHTLTLAAFSPTGGSTTDSNGYKVLAFNSEGLVAGKVQGGAQAGKDGPTRYVDVAGTKRPVNASGLHISISAKVPIASEQRGVAWEYVVVAVGPGDDPALLGRRFMVVGAPAKSFATARRLDVIEVHVPAVSPVTTIEFTFDTDGDPMGWLTAAEGGTVDATGGRLVATCAPLIDDGNGNTIVNGGGMYFEGSATGLAISASFDLAAESSLDTLWVTLDDRVTEFDTDNVPAAGLESPTHVTLGPVELTGTSFRLAVFGAHSGGEQIAIDNVVITITGG